MIIRDKDGGLICVRLYEKSNREVIGFAVGYDKGNVIELILAGERRFVQILERIEKGEVLHFSASALSESGSSIRKHSTISTGLLKRNKVKQGNIFVFSKYQHVADATDPGQKYTTHVGVFNFAEENIEKFKMKT